MFPYIFLEYKQQARFGILKGVGLLGLPSKSPKGEGKPKSVAF